VPISHWTTVSERAGSRRTVIAKSYERLKKAAQVSITNFFVNK